MKWCKKYGSQFQLLWKDYEVKCSYHCRPASDTCTLSAPVVSCQVESWIIKQLLCSARVMSEWASRVLKKRWLKIIVVSLKYLVNSECATSRFVEWETDVNTVRLRTSLMYFLYYCVSYFFLFLLLMLCKTFQLKFEVQILIFTKIDILQLLRP